jgi:hypothetical protein
MYFVLALIEKVRIKCRHICRKAQESDMDTSNRSGPALAAMPKFLVCKFQFHFAIILSHFGNYHYLPPLSCQK